MPPEMAQLRCRMSHSVVMAVGDARPDSLLAKPVFGF